MTRSGPLSNLANLILTDGEWRPALRELDRPALYVAQSGMRQQVEMVRALKPGARVELFAEAGHALFVDGAPRFNALLREFVRDSAAR